MNYSFIQMLGFISGILTTIAFIPQVLKVWVTRKTEDISLLMFIIFITGIIGWLIYGILIVNYPLILANSITLVLAVLIIIGKIRFG